MAVVLANVIDFERKVLINFFYNACIDSIANPRLRQRIIEDFIRDKTIQLAKSQLMFELHAIPILHEVRRWRVQVKLDAIPIHEQKFLNRKPGGGLECDPLFGVVICACWLRGNMQVKRKYR